MESPLTQRLENSIKLELYIEKEIECHTNRIKSSEAMLLRIPALMRDNDLALMKAGIILNIMKAELKAFQTELEIAKLQTSNIKTELELLMKGEAE